MKSKHTTGPWEAVYLSDVRYWTVITAWTNIEDDGSGISRHGIAIVFGVFGECEANAHLIAAAPDLLKACESMLATCGSSDNWNGETRESLTLIEAAILKATA